MPDFKLIEGGLQDQFLRSRAKVQLFGGGFANGKTASVCLKALQLAKDYPGSNGLIARATYPKLNDTIRKEFLKWCPKHWIESFPRSQNSSNTCTLTNGTMVNFRYVEQQGKSSGDATTSNTLSATYDWIAVDQIDDSEFVYKDFLDLLGRLRGMTPYIGDDPSMPKTGPRYLILTCNPTRGWPYRNLVKPVHDYREGRFNPNLLCVTNSDGRPLMVDGKPQPIIELFEGSTYSNQDNLTQDFIQTLESAYQGQMRDRYLLGEWAAYEGLVYHMFDESLHVIQHELVEEHYRKLLSESYKIVMIEGYDYGMAVPSCYIMGFVDESGNIFLMDGFYQKEMLFPDQCNEINRLRNQYHIPVDAAILADPDIFRRKATGSKKLVGQSLADMFRNEGIQTVRGNNDILNGIVKVQQYLSIQKAHRHPMTGAFGAPHLYISDRLTWAIDEMSDYRWKKDGKGDSEDAPIDKNDHAMDTIKYMLSKRPEIARIVMKPRFGQVGLRKWGERELPSQERNVRYG